MLKRGNSGPVIFTVVLAVSAAAHVWAVASLFQSRRGELGSTDIATAAISVNLETTDVIDAIESAAAREAASSPAGAPAEAAKTAREKPDDVKDDEFTPPPKSEKGKPQPDEPARLAAQADAERQRVEDEAEIQNKVKEEAGREETKHRADEATQAQKLAGTEEIEKKKREKARQIAAAGGAGTTGSADAQESQGRVSASQGSILNYGADLRALISSNTPHNIRKTSLRLGFSIAPSGGLAAVGIIAPSNDPEVDKRMVDLVRKLSKRFPPPPAGAGVNQLSFNIEIIFR